MNVGQINRMAVLFAGVAMLSSAGAASLKVGDPAPKLQVAKWVQGDPVKSFEPDKAYIVEFWATWCGPCKVSIPHLNEIHEKFKDKGLVVIGQDCWERDESLVGPFIKKMADKMTYHVALDDKEKSTKGAMAETWMEAAGQNGIPTAFIVDKESRIAWIGHPMGLKDETIEQVLAGKFDVKKAAADAETTERNQGELSNLSRKLSSAIADKDWDQAESTLTKLEKTLPEGQGANLDRVRFQIYVGKGDAKAAGKVAGQLSDAHKDDAMLQNELAWQLLTDKGIKERDVTLAHKIAVRANEAADGKDPAILDTLARAVFMQGDKEKAIELQEKAVKLAEGDQKDEIEQTLKSYKTGKLPEVE